MSRIKEIVRCDEPCDVSARSSGVASRIWFRTEPLDHTFLHHASHLQLVTESCDQGWVGDPTASIWSWFELVVYEDANAEKPKNASGRELVWHSHYNNLATAEESTRFGKVFDRRGDFLNQLEVGNIIAVRACARFGAWRNFASSGKFLARLVDDDVFAPNPWSLQTPDVLAPYCATSSTDCKVTAHSDEPSYTIWFLTPPLTKQLIDKVEEIQLFTNSHTTRGFEPSIGGVHNGCFEIVVLPSAGDHQHIPKVKEGRPLVWQSHDVPYGGVVGEIAAGRCFERGHEIFNNLEPGDVLAVRTCVRGKDWCHYGHDGRLVLSTGPEVLAKRANQSSLGEHVAAESQTTT